MIALYLAAHPAVAAPFWSVVVFGVLLIGPLLSWQATASRRFVTRAFIAGPLTVIGAAGVVVAQTICSPCTGCDEFWLLYFWICV